MSDRPETVECLCDARANAAERGEGFVYYLCAECGAGWYRIDDGLDGDAWGEAFDAVSRHAAELRRRVEFSGHVPGN